MELSCAFPTSHKIWRLCWWDCCHAELVWCAYGSSSHVPKIALPWGSQLRWRSVLQSEAAVNSYTLWGWRSKKSKVQKNVANSSTNEQSIIISCKSILIINRVLLPAWLIWFARWNLFALQVQTSINYNVKFALLELPINGFKTRWHAFSSLS